MKGRIHGLALGVLALTGSAAAQTEPAPPPPQLTISADRPGFSTGTDTVPPFHLQLESGLTFTSDNAADFRAWSLPQANLRFGLTQWSEVFVYTPSWISTNSDDGSADGVSDVTVGFKARFFRQSGARPNVTLIGTMGLPTGDHPFTADEPSPNVILAASWELPGGFSLLANGALGFPGDGGDAHYLQSSLSLSLGIPITDRLGAFVEYYGLYRADGGPPPENYADGGLTFLLTPRVQLDASVTFGLNSHAADISAGAGISILF